MFYKTHTTITHFFTSFIALTILLLAAYKTIFPPIFTCVNPAHHTAFSSYAILLGHFSQTTHRGKRI